jgi:hypothetical protein
MKEKVNSCRTLLVILGTVLSPGWVLSNDEVVQPATTAREPATHMSEELRSSQRKRDGQLQQGDAWIAGRNGRRFSNWHYPG